MGLIDLIFPRICFGCGRAGRYICDNCLRKLKITKPICPECERPSIDGLTHVKCKRAQGLDGLTSIWLYEGAVRKAIISLKYKFAYEIAKELSSYAASLLLKMNFERRAVLVPVPIHRLRENWRGFNQAGELGKLIAENLDWKFSPDLLVRKGLSRPQTGLKGVERQKNIRGVFVVNPHYSSFIIHNSFILFDDVWTTGSTLKEAAKVLKRNGAIWVWGLTIAR